MTYTENGITFNNVTRPNLNLESSPIGASAYPTTGTVVTFSGNAAEDHLMVNAIDIDWNGAQVGNTTINSTADLINWIKTIGSSNPSPAPVGEGGGIVFGYYGTKSGVKGIYDKPKQGFNIPSDATLLSTQEGILYVDMATYNGYALHTVDGETELTKIVTNENASETNAGLMSTATSSLLNNRFGSNSINFSSVIDLDGKTHYYELQYLNGISLRDVLSSNARFDTEFYIKVESISESFTVVKNENSSNIGDIYVRKTGFDALSGSGSKMIKIIARPISIELNTYDVLVEITAFDIETVQ